MPSVTVRPRQPAKVENTLLGDIVAERDEHAVATKFGTGAVETRTGIGEGGGDRLGKVERHGRMREFVDL